MDWKVGAGSTPHIGFEIWHQLYFGLKIIEEEMFLKSGGISEENKDSVHGNLPVVFPSNLQKSHTLSRLIVVTLAHGRNERT